MWPAGPLPRLEAGTEFSSQDNPPWATILVEPQFGQERQEQEDPSCCAFPAAVRTGSSEAADPRREVLPGRSGLQIAVDREVDLDRRGQKGGMLPHDDTGREID